MSLNQSRSDKNDSYRKSSRSNNQRNYSGGNSGAGGGGGGGKAGAAPPPSSSTTRGGYRKSVNGQSRVQNTDSNVVAARPGQNGAHVQQQPPLHGVSDAPFAKGIAQMSLPVPAPRSNRPVPKVPSSQPTASALAADSVAPTTPVKADGSKGITLQFGSFSPGFVNGIAGNQGIGMQIPARTSSAPPNLDEQKRDQARHDSFRAVPTLPIPSATKQQQQPVKDAGSTKDPISGESHASLAAPQVKRDVHSQVAAAPATTINQKPSVPSLTGMSMPMPMPFQSQVPLAFGGHNSQIQSQGVTASSMQMPMQLPAGSTAQMQFVQGLQSHPHQPQGMIPQGQGLNFPPHIGHQLAPQISTIGIVSPFAQQPAGKFSGNRKVKITHPDTHEELRLDKRTDTYMDGNSTGARSHPSVPPQSQAIPSFPPAHQISYYPTPYNPTPIYYPSPPTVSLTSTQITTGSQAPRYNFSVGQGPQNISFMNPSLNPIPAPKTGSLLHSVAEPLNVEHHHEAQAVAGSVTSASVQISVKPVIALHGEKVGSSTVKVSSPLVSKGESPKLLKPPKEAVAIHPQRDSEISSDSAVQQSRNVSEQSSSGSLSIKHSTTTSFTVSHQSLFQSTSPATPVPSEESGSVVTNTEGRRETVKKSDSFKDHPKKVVKKDPWHSQSQQQEDASDPAITSRSSLTPMEGVKLPENMRSPAEMVGSSTEYAFSKEGNSVEGKASCASLESSKGVLGSGEDPLRDTCVSRDASYLTSDAVQIGDESSLPPNQSVLELEGTSTEKLDVGRHAKVDLPEFQLNQETRGTVEQGNHGLNLCAKLDDGNLETLTSASESLVAELASKLTEMSVSKEPGSVEPGLDKNAVSPQCSEVGRMDDNLTRHATIGTYTVDEINTSSVVASTNSHDNRTSIANAPTTASEKSDNKDFFGTSHQELPGSTAHPLDSASKHKLKVTEATTGGQLSTSLSGSKDKPTELNRTKSAKGKKKIKDILKAADAAGSTSDLYMAYKSPEEKQETVVSSGNIDSSSNFVAKQELADAVAKEEDGQGKVEPDDWEDAADISTPKLKTSLPGKQGGISEDGNESSKKYTRDFLLTLAEHCIEVPASCEIGKDIVDALMSLQIGNFHLEPYPNIGRNMDRSSVGSRPDRRASGIVDDDKWNKSPGPFATGRDPRLDGGHGGAVTGFRPGQGGNHGVLRNPRGPTGQYGSGILSGPMQSIASQGGMHRSNSDADCWLRNPGLQKGLIPSPQTPGTIMHKAEKKYEVGKVSDQEQAKQRQLKAILNKLTPQNFEKLFEKVKEVNIDNGVTLKGVISQIFDKALMEPTFCEMYADFCFHLANELPDFVEDNEKITFKRLLLNKCQEEFERGEREQAEADRAEEDGEIECTKQEREEKRIQARRRMLGNIRLIGELYKKKMLTERIMHECIKKLLGQPQNPDEENIESLCKLMSTIGVMIDHHKAKEQMDNYFDTMMQLSENIKLSSRLRFMLKDSIDLRKNKWQQRRKVEGPKKIEEVHRDAAQERQAQASRLARGPSMSSSGRRGQPMDFGLRGPTMMSSPNSQMGGIRGFPPQNRGYGGQDARYEERQFYESRILSVPLSQRPIDDDSITLGPQGGLGRGMSVRGDPLISGAPLVDMSRAHGDSRRIAAGPNGYSSAADWKPHAAREESGQRYPSGRSMPMSSYDHLNSQERHAHSGNKDVRSADRTVDRPIASPGMRAQGYSNASVPLQAASEKVLPEERLRDMSIAAIREFYSAKDKEEVALCVKDLNSPGFYPSMVSIWVTDSFERKDLERDLLAMLLVDLTNHRDSLLSQVQLMKGFESVLSTLEDTVNDAPKAAEFLGRIFAKVILEDVVPFREIGRLIHEGGEEPGRLLEIGLASEVVGSILEIIRSEKGESVLNEIRISSNLRLEDFRPPDPIKSRKLDAFI